jgi:hypothetical protein
MAATAEVIDLGEVRRRRRLEQAKPAAAPPQVVPFGWLPVLFFIPVWISTISPELLRAQA